MFNLSTRVQTLANQALSAAMAVAVLIVAMTWVKLVLDGVWLIDYTSISNIKPSASMKRSFYAGSVGRKPKENSKITFDLEADVSPLFNWNTKQVFVYLTAEYPGKRAGSSNKVTYCDKIITSKKDAKIALKNFRSKYSVWDVEPSFRDREAVLRLEWNIQPWVGPLVFGETAAASNFTFASPKKAE